MSAELDALIERLEQIEVGACLDDAERLASALTERQTIISKIAAVDPASLPEDERARLKQRMLALAIRDQDVLADLQALREEMQKAMDTLNAGRAAVRGYGSQSGAPPPQVRRIG